MDSTKIKSTVKKIYDLLQERRLKEAFVLLKLLADALQQWAFNDKLSEIETSYRYMIQYMLDGFQDPKRAQIYNGLILSAYTLADKMADSLLEKESSSLYYNRRRYRRSQSDFNIEEQAKKLEKSTESLALNLSISQEKGEPADRENLLRTDEQEESNLFLDVWTNYPASEQDIQWLKSLLVSDTISDIRLGLLITAVTLNLLHYYDERKLMWLLSAYAHPSPLVRQRALVGALLIIYRNPDRVRLSSRILSTLDIMAENQNLKRDVCNIFMQLIKSRETEKISRKFTEEILPEMMKLGPSVYGKISQEDLMNDTTALDKNPEWQEILDHSGVGDKLKEMSELQMEGADVFMSTFSSLKSFPFFNDLSNWFIPFNPKHSALRKLFGDNPHENILRKVLESSAFLCNSDKYSFALTISQVSPTQRETMMGQFIPDGSDMNELIKDESTLKSSPQDEIASNQYIQDLYRFFKLYPRKNEFDDPFVENPNFYRNPTLRKLFDNDENLRIIAEFLLKKEYYEEALEIFNDLSLHHQSDGELHQKTGYCHQMLRQYEDALEAYLKADMINPNSFWTIRRIASCYRSLKKPEMALEYYRRADTLRPDNLAIEMNIGHCYFEQKQYMNALQHYFKVDYLDPKNPRAWRPIAWCSFLEKKNEQARRYYEKILAEKPSAQDYMNAGHVEFALGNIKAALNLYRQSIEKDGFNLERFLTAFRQDEEDLKSHGIAPEDIPILLDQLMYSVSH